MATDEDLMLHFLLLTSSASFGLLAWLYVNVTMNSVAYSILAAIGVTCLYFIILYFLCKSESFKNIFPYVGAVLIIINLLDFLLGLHVFREKIGCLLYMWIFIVIFIIPILPFIEKIGASFINPVTFYLYGGLILYFGGLILKLIFPSIVLIDYIMLLGSIFLLIWGYIRGLTEV